MGIKKLVRISAPSDRREAPRRLINRLAKIQLGSGALPRDCLITDISTGGVRLHVEGYDVPDRFVLLLSGEGLAKECSYQVVWRLGHEIGAQFIGVIRRTGGTSARMNRRVFTKRAKRPRQNRDRFTSLTTGITGRIDVLDR